MGCARAAEAVEWNYEVLRAAWPYIDYLTAHIYWRFGEDRPDAGYEGTLARAHDDDRTLGMLGGLIGLVAREMGGRHQPGLAITEWNAGDVSHRQMSPEWRPGRTQYRLVDALTVAGFLNAMQRHCRVVKLANFAQTINVVGALVVTPDAVLRESVYWALYLQRNYSGPVSVHSRADCGGRDVTLADGRAVSLPDLDVSATRSEDGARLWLSIVNRNRGEEVVARIRLQGAKPRPAAESWELWTDDPLAMNTLDDPGRISPRQGTRTVGPTFELPLKPHSYTVLEIGLDGLSPPRSRWPSAETRWPQRSIFQNVLRRKIFGLVDIGTTVPDDRAVARDRGTSRADAAAHHPQGHDRGPLGVLLISRCPAGFSGR